MGYLKTVVTYNVPAEAEIDKAYLESHGLTVCLLNANTSRNELGAPFFIQLQVADGEHGQATELLREANPSRFGSQAVVDEIDRAFKRVVLLFLLGAIPTGALLYTIAPAPDYNPDLPIYVRQPSDPRPYLAAGGALLGGVLAIMLGKRKSPLPPPAIGR